MKNFTFSRKHNALAHNSAYIDIYSWNQDLARHQFIISASTGIEIPVMTADQLQSYMIDWINHEASGEWLIDGVHQSKKNEIKRLTTHQLDSTAELMHSIDSRCIDWIIDVDQVEIIVSADQKITLDVNTFGIAADSDSKTIFNHILRQFNLFTRK